MKFTSKDLDWAVTQGLLTPVQKHSLVEALKEHSKNRPRFDLAHVGLYAGALIVILAMTWFLAISWEPFGHGGILMISSVYALAFLFAGNRCWNNGLCTPGGLLVTLAVCMTPLIIYGLERLLGIWPQADPGQYTSFHQYVKGGWFLMECGTIGAALLALRFYKFPFMVAPIAFCLWYMSMDVTPLFFGQTQYTWEQRCWVSTFFGLTMLAIAYYIDLKAEIEQDFAFWLYLFGTVAFWFGLRLCAVKGETGEFLFAVLNVGLMLLSVLLQRKIFIIFGAIGCVGYLGHLAWEVFKDWMMFPIALSFLGIAMIWLAVKYQRNQPAIEAFIHSLIPAGMKAYLPSRQAGG